MRLEFMRYFMLFFLTTWLSVAVLAQVPTATTPSAQSAGLKYLFRFQRVRYLETGCVLVRSDGEYRYERNHAGKSGAWEGRLSAPEVDNLLVMLNADELRSLSQGMIPTQQVSGPDIDLLQIGIARPGHWQNLDFATPYSRKPFSRSIDPLMSWYEEMRKAPHVKLSDQLVNNCMPVSSTASGSGGTSKTVTENGSENVGDVLTSGLYLLRMRTQTIDAQRREILTTCFIAYSNGRYRLEDDSQYFTDAPKARVHSGTLSEEDLQAFREILNSADIKALGYRDIAPTPERLVEGEITEVSIPRKAGTQNIYFRSIFGSPHYRPDPAFYAPGTPEAIGRLKQWVQKNVGHRKGSPAGPQIATGCVPSREESQTGVSAAPK